MVSLFNRSVVPMAEGLFLRSNVLNEVDQAWAVPGKLAAIACTVHLQLAQRNVDRLVIPVCQLGKLTAHKEQTFASVYDWLDVLGYKSAL